MAGRSLSSWPRPGQPEQSYPSRPSPSRPWQPQRRRAAGGQRRRGRGGRREKGLYFSYTYANLASTYTNRVNVYRYPGSGAVFTYFLQGLADGSSFTDTVNGVTVTQVSHDVNTATVQVALTCAPTAPTLSVSPTSQSSKDGATVNYAVSVTNKDSAACPQATVNLAALWSQAAQVQ
jgi:hypothetical protein